MNSRVQVLSEDLVNKIAAGEVVERPASVVKELLENSIDAKARRIDIEIHNGGADLIRVTDNGIGIGMGADDLLLSIERHATSKISSLSELFSIDTLGFRGEALPSIASVSKFRISSRAKEQNRGYEIVLDGARDQIPVAREVGIPFGTTVIVENLFYNTPARLKYLKSVNTETGHINEIISKYILAYPDIAFKLSHNGKDILSSPGNGKLLDAAAAIYGSKLAKDLLEVDYTRGNYRVRGLISKPTLTRINRDHQSFYVNGRYIKNIMISRAVEDAYHALIPHDRHPFALIFLEVPNNEVDHNVHPTKREVRFLKLNEVMFLVREAVKSVIAGAGVGANYNLPRGGETINVPVTDKWIPTMDKIWNDQVMTPAREFMPVQVQDKDGIRAVAQVALTYIIAVDGSDILLIDQHAAHERMIYESLEVEKHSQQLLVPETIELTVAEKSKVADKLDYLKNIGFEIDDFGEAAFLLRAVPYSVGKVPARELFSDIVSELIEMSGSIKLEDAHKRIKQVIACRSAIMAGDKLNQMEMQNILEKLVKTPNYSTCPHGRPSIVRISEAELAKMFGR
ncbi:MAG: DNA mismatch repair endonuclease MutL [bacterium]